MDECPDMGGWIVSRKLVLLEGPRQYPPGGVPQQYKAVRYERVVGRQETAELWLEFYSYSPIEKRMAMQSCWRCDDAVERVRNLKQGKRQRDRVRKRVQRQRKRYAKVGW